MKSLIGNEEAKLVLALMGKKAEVPEDLKAKALEQLRVFSMACEAGSAKSYLIDQMIEAIEAGDIDKVEEIAMLASACFNDEDGSKDVFVSPETEATAKAAVDGFFEDMKSKGLPDGAIGSMLKVAFNEFDFLPLMYQDEMLAGYSGKHDCILVFGIGFAGGKTELIDKFQATDQRIDMLHTAIDEFDISGKAEVHFLTIQYNMLGENDVELIIKGLR